MQWPSAIQRKQTIDILIITVIIILVLYLCKSQFVCTSFVFIHVGVSLDNILSSPRANMKNVVMLICEVNN